MAARDHTARFSGCRKTVSAGETRRFAMTRAEAARALGMSINSFERHVQPELRIVRRGKLRLFPFARSSAGWRKTRSGSWRRDEGDYARRDPRPQGEDMAKRLPEGICLRHARSCPSRQGALPLHADLPGPGLEPTRPKTAHQNFPHARRRQGLALRRARRPTPRHAPRGRQRHAPPGRRGVDRCRKAASSATAPATSTSPRRCADTSSRFATRLLPALGGASSGHPALGRAAARQPDDGRRRWRRAPSATR